MCSLVQTELLEGRAQHECEHPFLPLSWQMKRSSFPAWPWRPCSSQQALPARGTGAAPGLRCAPYSRLSRHTQPSKPGPQEVENQTAVLVMSWQS